MKNKMMIGISLVLMIIIMILVIALPSLNKKENKDYEFINYLLI